MEINYLVNEVGDTLSPVKNTDKVALFRVIDSQKLRFKDVFFVTAVEEKQDEYGRKIHLAGGSNWEQAGAYVKGEKNALAKYEALTTGKDTESYYKSKIQ